MCPRPSGARVLKQRLSLVQRKQVISLEFLRIIFPAKITVSFELIL